MNRKVHEEPARGHVDVFEEDFDGCEDKDRKAGVCEATGSALELVV